MAKTHKLKRHWLVINPYSGSSDYYLTSNEHVRGNARIPIATPEFRRAWNAFIEGSKQTHKRHRTWKGYSKILPIGKIREDLAQFDATLDHYETEDYHQVKLLRFNTESGLTVFIFQWLTTTQDML